MKIKDLLTKPDHSTTEQKPVEDKPKLEPIDVRNLPVKFNPHLWAIRERLSRACETIRKVWGYPVMEVEHKGRLYVVWVWDEDERYRVILELNPEKFRTVDEAELWAKNKLGEWVREMDNNI